jgi:hypothetical protein
MPAAIISAGKWITASGEWANDRTHGQQFKARFLKTSAPSSIDGIEKYLGSGMIRGIRGDTICDGQESDSADRRDHPPRNRRSDEGLLQKAFTY